MINLTYKNYPCRIVRNYGDSSLINWRGELIIVKNSEIDNEIADRRGCLVIILLLIAFWIGLILIF